MIYRERYNRKKMKVYIYKKNYNNQILRVKNINLSMKTQNRRWKIKFNPQQNSLKLKNKKC